MPWEDPDPPPALGLIHPNIKQYEGPSSAEGGGGDVLPPGVLMGTASPRKEAAGEVNRPSLDATGSGEEAGRGTDGEQGAAVLPPGVFWDADGPGGSPSADSPAGPSGPDLRPAPSGRAPKLTIKVSCNPGDLHKYRAKERERDSIESASTPFLSPHRLSVDFTSSWHETLSRAAS